jgi:hypothetical protein
VLDGLRHPNGAPAINQSRAIRSHPGPPLRVGNQFGSGRSQALTNGVEIHATLDNPCGTGALECGSLGELVLCYWHNHLGHANRCSLDSRDAGCADVDSRGPKQRVETGRRLMNSDPFNRSQGRTVWADCGID